MDKATLVLFRTKLKEIHFTMITNVKEKLKTKKDNLNEQVADIADDAAQSYNRELLMEFGTQDLKKLRLVEEAIEKTKTGKYGVCSECEEQIPEARLKVIPFAAQCIDCLKAIEKNN